MKGMGFGVKDLDPNSDSQKFKTIKHCVTSVATDFSACEVGKIKHIALIWEN
jgi:hypothetical protein